MNKQDALKKIAMTLLSKDQENKNLSEENESLKNELNDQHKLASIERLVDEMVERGVISDTDKEAKREEMMAKSAEEISEYKTILNDLISNAPSIGEVSKEADIDESSDKFDQWLLS